VGARAAELVALALHPQLRQQRQLPAEVYVFQLNWSALETCLVQCCKSR
jgi:phenylalanyl-tRNA synthetase beta subunit